MKLAQLIHPKKTFKNSIIKMANKMKAGDKDEILKNLDLQLKKDLEECDDDLLNLDETTFVHKYLMAIGFWDNDEAQYQMCKRHPKLINLV